MFVRIYDAVVRALRWPIIANAITTIIAAPIILTTGMVPPEALNLWTWISAGLSGTLFVLTVPDMRNQRAVHAFNALARENRDDNDYRSQWSKPIGQDRAASVILKIMFVEYVVAMFSNMSLAVHLLAALFGVGCVVIVSIKYDPDVQKRLTAEDPSRTGQVARPAETLMARFWVFTGLAGLVLVAAFAVASFGFDQSFYYRFGPYDGEKVPPHILGGILGGLAFAFAILFLRGWLSLRKTKAVVAGPE